ncbi:hypothetical protein EWB00_008184 [Schistosoma japonicum]|uniref:Uncharacterized protein n=1 Tax=Schistosoma japonicum TaxID=6182 RepID=A0A4Z2CR27_SCHJA|nr:hypothetical protein EWB00_008184 [Schistosoma japonicum]
MQSMKLFNLLRRENIITLGTLRLASTTKSPTPRSLDTTEHVKDDKKSQPETVYKVPEYYEHKTFCFYDSEIQLKELLMFPANFYKYT